MGKCPLYPGLELVLLGRCPLSSWQIVGMPKRKFTRALEAVVAIIACPEDVPRVGRMSYWGLKYGLEDVKSELKKIEERLERLENMMNELLNELRKA